ncbi:MAG: hypothetical protein ACYC6I_05245 [Bacillota bacterium]
MNFIGVDLTPITLAGYEPTGFCVLKKDDKGLPVLAECFSLPEGDTKAARLVAEVYEARGEARVAAMSRLVAQVNQELVDLIIEFMPGIVGFSAALSLPDGRAGYDLRLADHILEQDPRLRAAEAGLRSPVKAPARAFRGLVVRELLDAEGLVYGEDVIEVSPRGSLAYLGLPTEIGSGQLKHEGLPDKLLKLIRVPRSPRLPQTGSEYSALVAAFTGYLRFIGATEEVGDPLEGNITLPRRTEHAGSH